jgi:hypothetical protein
MKHNFVAFILTHKRPDKIYTDKTIRKCGYTGPIVYVVDSLDPTIDQYEAKYPGQVQVFNKADYVGKFDQGDNLQSMKGIVYARNACFDIAEKLGYDYFIELDDDYTQFRHAYDNKEPREFNSSKSAVKNMDEVFDAMVDLLISGPLHTVAFLQGGDLFGGVYKLFIKRKAMNSFVCATNRRFTFNGSLNEDVNVYTVDGSRGILMYSVPEIALNQVQTQKSKGGMTEQYLENGTFVKSFYTIMFNPSSVKISLMGANAFRFHHKIDWKCTVPKILSQEHKK